MIRLLRIFSVVVLVAALAVFALASVQDYLERDDTIPTLSVTSNSIEVTSDYTIDDLLEGVSAFDEKDGDLTDQVLVGSFTRFIQPGVSTLSYTVFDSSGNMATLTREVRFTDYHSPRFALSAPLVFVEGSSSSTAALSLFSATDVLDGDLTDWITSVTSTVSYNNPGDYTVTLEVSNSFGDTVSYAFPVHIYERGTQTVSIELTEPLIYISQGESFDPLAYVEAITDNSGTTYTVSDLEISSDVDTDTPGIYEVCYQIGNSGDDNFGQMWLIVIVEESLL